jgi:sodium/potassium-transporting ATPase subunit alpha
MAQVGNAFAVRSESNRGRSLGWFSNRFLWIGVGIEISLILILIYFRPLAETFQHHPFPSIFWIWLVFYPLVLYGLEWLRKLFSWKMKKGLDRVNRVSIKQSVEAQ